MAAVPAPATLSARTEPHYWQQLTLAAQAGDSAAQDRLFRWARRVALTRIRTRGYYLPGGEVEDLAQTAMLGLLRAIRTYDPARGPARALLLLAIQRSLTASLRCSRRRKHAPLNDATRLEAPAYGDHHSGRTVADVLALEATDTLRDPAVILIEREERAALVARLQDLRHRLSPLEWRVVELRAAGLDYRQVAQILDISTKSVDNALQRTARKASGRPSDTRTGRRAERRARDDEDRVRLIALIRADQTLGLQELGRRTGRRRDAVEKLLRPGGGLIRIRAGGDPPCSL